MSYYAVFTSQAYFYFVLEGRSNTSTVAKDYMYAGEGTMIVPDGFNSGDRWYDGSNFSIADYISPLLPTRPSEMVSGQLTQITLLIGRIP